VIALAAVLATSSLVLLPERGRPGTTGASHLRMAAAPTKTTLGGDRRDGQPLARGPMRKRGSGRPLAIRRLRRSRRPRSYVGRRFISRRFRLGHALGGAAGFADRCARRRFGSCSATSSTGGRNSCRLKHFRAADGKCSTDDAAPVSLASTDSVAFASGGSSVRGIDGVLTARRKLLT